MKFTFLGTCSGTEPMENRHHSSVTLEINGTVYWFDAGENCSHRAYTMGIDHTRVRAVFISHMHIDHIGGLANLIFTIFKIADRTGKPHINGNAYDVFVPDIAKYDSVYAVATGYRGASSIKVKPIAHEVHDGVIFEDENIRVSALHNTHLKENGERGWHAYSYLIEAEGKRVVFSGDVGYPEELEPYLSEGCDLLIMETGHHKVSDVIAYAKARRVPRLLFTHHGREILADPSAAEARIAEAGINAAVLNDGDTEIL